MKNTIQDLKPIKIELGGLTMTNIFARQTLFSNTFSQFDDSNDVNHNDIEDDNDEKIFLNHEVNIESEVNSSENSHHAPLHKAPSIAVKQRLVLHDTVRFQI